MFTKFDRVKYPTIASGIERYDDLTEKCILTDELKEAVCLFTSILVRPEPYTNAVEQALSDALHFPLLSKICEKGKPKKVVCDTVWSVGDRVYRCLDCQVDTGSALCARCFEMDKHRGHRVMTQSSGGGCCDCGDESAWAPEGFCSRHAAAYKERQNMTEETLIGYIPPESRVQIQGLCLAVLLFTAKQTTDVVDEEGYNGEKVATSALKFLKTVLCDLGDGATRLCAKVVQMRARVLMEAAYPHSMIDENPVLDLSLLDFIVSHDMELKPEARKALDAFYFYMITDNSFKCLFLIVVLRFYQFLNQNNLNYSPEANTDVGVLHLSVQLFSGKSLNLTHVDRVELAIHIMECMKSSLRLLPDGSYDPDCAFYTERRYLGLFCDIDYAMSRPQQTYRGTFFERDDFMNALLDLVCYGTNSALYTCVRTGDHVLYESKKWRYEISFFLLFCSLSRTLCQDFDDSSISDECRIRICRLIVERVFLFMKNDDEKLCKANNLNADDSLLFDTLTMPVEFSHLPQWICMMFLKVALGHKIPLESLIPESVDISSFAYLLTLWPARLKAVCGQEEAR